MLLRYRLLFVSQRSGDHIYNNLHTVGDYRLLMPGEGSSSRREKEGDDEGGRPDSTGSARTCGFSRFGARLAVTFFVIAVLSTISFFGGRLVFVDVDNGAASGAAEAAIADAFAALTISVAVALDSAL